MALGRLKLQSFILFNSGYGMTIPMSFLVIVLFKDGRFMCFCQFYGLNIITLKRSCICNMYGFK